MRKKPDRRGQSKPPPGVERRRADRRRSDRIVVDLKVEFQTAEMYLYAFTTDLSALGMFVFTRSPYPVGTRLRLRFEMPAQAKPLEAEGEVRWTSVPKRGQTAEPGMGVAFSDISPELVEKLSSLIKRVIYFEADSDD